MVIKSPVLSRWWLSCLENNQVEMPSREFKKVELEIQIWKSWKDPQSINFLSFKNCGTNAYNIKCIILAIFQCTVQWCYDFSHCCEADLQDIFILQKWNSIPIKGQLPTSPPLASATTILACFHEPDYFRQFMSTDAYSICLPVTSLFHLV